MSEGLRRGFGDKTCALCENMLDDAIMYECGVVHLHVLLYRESRGHHSVVLRLSFAPVFSWQCFGSCE